MVEIRLYDVEGSVVTGTGPDAAGELYVRSPSVFADYYKQHDKFEEDHRDGFQTVGDIAYRDDEGFVYICDRKKDMIISGGFNVYPSEVEQVLWSHPAVQDCAVIGVPHEEWGEAVTAVVELNPGARLTEEELIAYCRPQLGGIKTPKKVAFMDVLPRSANGKVLKKDVREPFWRGHERQI